MRFELVDRVLERTPGTGGGGRIVTIKHVSAAEEYLGDHFPGFPILPGVMMLEAMTQAARELLDPRGELGVPLVLGRARALKYARMVRPGESLRVEVNVGEPDADGASECTAKGYLLVVGGDPADAPLACSGRFTMRPARIEPAQATPKA
ncbi:MAG: hypothetical protein AAF995_09925 [Planctomycetota bacterium]